MEVWFSTQLRVPNSNSLWLVSAWGTGMQIITDYYENSRKPREKHLLPLLDDVWGFFVASFGVFVVFFCVGFLFSFGFLFVRGFVCLALIFILFHFPFQRKKKRYFKPSKLSWCIITFSQYSLPFRVSHCGVLSHIFTEHLCFSQRYVCALSAEVLWAIVLHKEKSPSSVLYFQTQPKQRKLMWKWKSLKCEWVSLGIIFLSATELDRGTDVWGGGAALWRLIVRVSFGRLGKIAMWIKGTCLVRVKTLINETHYSYFWRVLGFFKNIYNAVLFLIATAFTGDFYLCVWISNYTC